MKTLNMNFRLLTSGDINDQRKYLGLKNRLGQSVSHKKPGTILVGTLLLVLILAIGCSDQGSLRENGPQHPNDSEHSDEIRERATTNDEPLQSEQTEPAQPTPTEQETVTSEEADEAQSEATKRDHPGEPSHDREEDEVVLPVDIFGFMASSDWIRESDRDLADYLPVPLGAQGQVGRFTRDLEIVTIARVTYPDEVFANPHENWIRERMDILPDSHERVVRKGATVIHIVAEQSQSADELASMFSNRESQEDIGSGAKFDD